MTSQDDSTESDEDEDEDETTIQPDAKRSRSEVSVTPEPDDPDKRRKLIKYQRLWDESVEYRNTSTMMGRLRNSPKQGKRYPYKGYNNDSEYDRKNASHPDRLWNQALMAYAMENLVPFSQLPLIMHYGHKPIADCDSPAILLVCNDGTVIERDEAVRIATDKMFTIKDQYRDPKTEMVRKIGDKWEHVTKKQKETLMPWGEPVGPCYPSIYNERLELFMNPCLLAGFDEEDKFWMPGKEQSRGPACKSTGRKRRKGRHASKATSQDNEMS